MNLVNIFLLLLSYNLSLFTLSIALRFSIAESHARYFVNDHPQVLDFTLKKLFKRATRWNNWLAQDYYILTSSTSTANYRVPVGDVLCMFVALSICRWFPSKVIYFLASIEPRLMNSTLPGGRILLRKSCRVVEHFVSSQTRFSVF